MGRASRDKGARREREIVNRHIAAGCAAQRVPLSGQSRYRGNGADVDIYLRGRDSAPFVAEVKARGDGDGFATIARWLGENDLLFLVADRADPLVVVPWERWLDILEILGARRYQPPGTVTDAPDGRDDGGLPPAG